MRIVVVPPEEETSVIAFAPSCWTLFRSNRTPSVGMLRKIPCLDVRPKSTVTVSTTCTLPFWGMEMTESKLSITQLSWACTEEVKSRSNGKSRKDNNRFILIEFTTSLYYSLFLFLSLSRAIIFSKTHSRKEG